MNLKTLFEKNFWHWFLGIILIAKFTNDVNESGFWKILPAYHVFATVLATAFFLSILSYALESRWVSLKNIFDKDILISGSISITLVIAGLIYWSEKHWIGFAGFTLVFYLIFFGYGFLINLFRRNK